MRYLIFLIFLLFHVDTWSQHSILIDGNFEDWENVNTTYIDTPNEGVDYDLLMMQITNDENYLYIHFELNTEIQLMGDLFQPTIFLYIDTDNNTSTGYDSQWGYGSELGVLFKQRFAYYSVEPFSTVELNRMNMIAAPTVSAKEFEVAIHRESIPDYINPLFPSNTIKIALQETTGDDFIPNDGEVITYDFFNGPTPDYIPISFTKESTDNIRLLAYNTLFDGIIDSDLQEEFERIIQSVQPNIIAFSECASTSAAQVKYRLDQWVPTDNSEGWYVLKDDYDLITASQWPIIDSWPEIDRQFPVLIDLPESYPRNLLLTNSHLKCCNGNAQRQMQVDEYAAFIQDAKSPGGSITLEPYTPIIYAGDLNLVGYGQQLKTLLTGEIENTSIYGEGGPMDWDNSDNRDLIPAHSDQNYAYTWENEFSEYTPSRIDYIIYSDAVVSAEKSFVINTKGMSAERLLAENLEENDTYFASDHFPLVMDFSFVPNTTMVDDSEPTIAVMPNPSSGKFYVTGLDTGTMLVLLDVYGRILSKETVFKNDIEIDLSGAVTGIYYLRVYHNQYSKTLKLVKE